MAETAHRTSQTIPTILRRRANLCLKQLHQNQQNLMLKLLLIKKSLLLVQLIELHVAAARHLARPVAAHLVPGESLAAEDTGDQNTA